MTSSWPKRLISPSGIAFVVLCFFFPFFSVSCSGVLGSLEVSYSGMALAFDGAPHINGTLADELGPGDLQELEVGVVPALLISLVTLIAGGVLSGVLPGRVARSASGLSAAALTLVLVVVNQVGMHSGFQEEVQAEVGEAYTQYGHLEATAGLGFWLVCVGLFGVLLYNAVDLSLYRRGPVPGTVTAGGMPPGGPPAPPGYGPPEPGAGAGPVPGPPGSAHPGQQRTSQQGTGRPAYGPPPGYPWQAEPHGPAQGQAPPGPGRSGQGMSDQGWPGRTPPGMPGLLPPEHPGQGPAAGPSSFGNG